MQPLHASAHHGASPSPQVQRREVQPLQINLQNMQVLVGHMLPLHASAHHGASPSPQVLVGHMLRPFRWRSQWGRMTSDVLVSRRRWLSTDGCSHRLKTVKMIITQQLGAESRAVAGHTAADTHM